MNTDQSFLELHQKSMSVLGFWAEENGSFIHLLESRYKTEILMEWGISNFVINGDKILVKWYKRFNKMSEEEINSLYGRVTQ